MSIKIQLTAVKTGSIKEYEDYETFISDWRFWFGSGSPCECSEMQIEKVIKTLEGLDDHGTAIEIILNGLYIKIVYYKWADFNRNMEHKK